MYQQKNLKINDNIYIQNSTKYKKNIASIIIFIYK